MLAHYLATHMYTRYFMYIIIVDKKVYVSSPIRTTLFKVYSLLMGQRPMQCSRTSVERSTGQAMLS